ncbi:MAG: tRNA (N(6)-L-threonylcarbamoyladenosine(37)-C(2))-methylthiotransferase MtaB [Muribaculaceae bacterium]|nr:tRNA (N(6)-L-threonylcarbamoyladenosine(37)-C(2))-methylthiotransferase MtaB [Muribaculaceae bacterium]
MSTFGLRIDNGLTAAYFTLGCKLNFAETSTIGRQLGEMGIREAAEGESPDICIVNTCSVTQMADKKARTLIRRVVRDYPEACVVVTGCYAQLKPDEISRIEGVDLVVGNKDKGRISRLLAARFGTLPEEDEPEEETGAGTEEGSFTPSCARGDRTRFFLKVQDGCDYYCTYCTIPFARGRSRSGRIADLTEQARQAAEEGGKEIVITGVNIGDFGKNTGESFFDLLKELDGVEGISRYRISSIEPNLLTDEIIEWIAAESRAYMPHFHIPLQSGSDAVLRKMNRRYDTMLFRNRIEKIRRLMPEAFIGVDVIAGARGETPEEWARAVEFIESLPVTRLHVFPYSERPGTAALLLDHPVDKNERDRRAAELIALSERKLNAFMESQTGREREVLWEHEIKGSGLMTGLTDNYLRVAAPLRPELLNSISRVRLTGIDTTRPETMTAEHV